MHKEILFDIYFLLYGALRCGLHTTSEANLSFVDSGACLAMDFYVSYHPFILLGLVGPYYSDLLASDLLSDALRTSLLRGACSNERFFLIH